MVSSLVFLRFIPWAKNFLKYFFPILGKTSIVISNSNFFYLALRYNIYPEINLGLQVMAKAAKTRHYWFGITWDYSNFDTWCENLCFSLFVFNLWLHCISFYFKNNSLWIMKKDLELKLFFVIKNYVRFHSISKLDQLERMNDNRESQRVQALLISHRILNQMDPGNPHPFFPRRLRDVSRV